jgi:hypothetical protein
MIKVVMIICFLAPVHFLYKFTQDNTLKLLLGWLDNIMYLFVFFREVLSNLENIYEINPKYAPQWLIKKFKVFNTTGDLDSIRDIGSNNTTNSNNNNNSNTESNG